MATVSAVGVFATDWLYRDNTLVTTTFRGQDMVTLVVAVPLLLFGLVWEMRGSLRGRVLWLGMLFYTRDKLGEAKDAGLRSWLRATDGLTARCQAPSTRRHVRLGAA